MRMRNANEANKITFISHSSNTEFGVNITLFRNIIILIQAKLYDAPTRGEVYFA